MEKQGPGSNNKKREIEERIAELRAEKDEIARGRIKLEKMTKDISNLKVEIDANKKKEGDLQYEQAMMKKDNLMTEKMEKLINDMQLENEEEEISDYEDYEDYLTKNSKRKIREATKKAGIVVGTILEKSKQNDQKKEELHKNFEESRDLKLTQESVVLDSTGEEKNKIEEKREEIKKIYRAGDIVEFDEEFHQEPENIEPETQKSEESRGKEAEEKGKENLKLVEIEKRVEETREKYIEEYKKCKKEADKQTLINKTKNVTFNILAGVKNLFHKDKIKYIEKVIRPEDYFTEETKKAKTEYDEIRKEMGNEMFNRKKAELEKASLFGEELEKALTNYKAIEILAKTITEEKQKLINAKTEKPVLLKRLLTGYMALKPRWKRVALSTLIFLPLSATGALGASAIAAGGLFAGIAGLAGVKFATSMAIGYGVGYLSHGVDLVKKKSDLEFEKNQNNKKLELVDKFSKDEIRLEEYEKEMEVIHKEEKKRTRDRIILKAGVGGAMALVAGFVAYDTMGNGLDHIKGVPSTSNLNVLETQVKTNVPETSFEKNGLPITDETMENGQIFNPYHLVENIKPENSVPQTLPEIVVTPESHAEVIATADHGQGAISTLRELQNNLKTEYPDINNAPENVKYILNTDAHELAKEFKMYQPGQEAESALIKAGSYFKVDESGDVTFHDGGTTEGIQIMEKSYSGQMIDSDHPETQISEGVETTDHTTNTENLSGNEEAGSDFLKNNPQFNPEAIDQGNVSSGLEYTKEPESISNPEDLPEKLTTLDNNQNHLNQESNEGVKTGRDFNEEGARGSEIAQGDKIQTDHHDFSPQELRQIGRVYEHNINHIFRDEKGLDIWENVKDRKAENLFYNMNLLKPEYRSLHTYMHDLNEVTGVEPIRETLITRAETISEFIKRALEKATVLGKLKEVKL